MSKPDRREILSRVAAGVISPEQAAAQLDSIDDGEEVAEPSIHRVRVARPLGALEIVGDPTVREAVAEGPHRARIEGDTMIFEAETTSEAGGFIFGFGHDWAQPALRIRMNPSLALDLQVQAGSCRVRGVEGPIRADVQAGSASIDGFRGELALAVQAGSFKGTGRLEGGESRISCDAGSVALNLERGSSVRIKAHANMGKVELPSGGSNRFQQESTVGGGSGLLVIETTMGSVRVSAES